MAHLIIGIIYISFISLGLPDALLGSAWPVIHQELGVRVSTAGVISTLISCGTIFSSLQSDRLTRALGSGKVTAISVGLTALALYGFSVSDSFWMLCLWAIPYGLGAGSVDAALNNYVALHYSSRHMSWLHCMWGVGAAAGPYIMSWVLTRGQHWTQGYRIVAIIQIILSIVLFLSLPIWRRREVAAPEKGSKQKSLSLGKIIAIPGAREVLLMFFCYCALESTAGLWGASYFVMKDAIAPDYAAALGSLFYLGITGGRAISGFLTMKFNDTQMIHIGLFTLGLGIAVMLLPLGIGASAAGLVLVGLGCAPVFPCVIHSTPAHFGADKSQAIIGVQMACAYVGSLVMPPLFGVLADIAGAGCLPVFLGIVLALMAFMNRRLNKICPI